MDDGLIDTVTTDQNGRVFLSLEDGDYYAVEIEAGKGFRVDPTPHYFTVADGKTTKLTITNKAFTGVLIHKVDSVSGRGIPDVTFLVYDGDMNPIDQVTTDQNGYAYINDLGFFWETLSPRVGGRGLCLRYRFEDGLCKSRENS